MAAPTSPAPITSTRRPSRPPRRSPATVTAADGTDTAWRPMAVSVRARLPTSTAWRKTRDTSGPIMDSCSATRHASRTCPRISPSPTIIESTPAATPNRCATAASSWYVYRWSLIVSGSSDDWSVRKLRTSSTAGWKRVQRA